MDYLEARGIEIGAFLEEVGLAPELRGDPDARIRHSEQEALWRHAIEVTADPLLPARVAKQFPPDVIGVMLYLAKASRDGVDAVNRLQDLIGLMADDTDLVLDFEPGLAVLHIRSRGDYVPILPACEYNAAIQVFVGRELSSGTREPREVRIPHATPPHAAEFEAFLGIPVRYGTTHSAVAFQRDQFSQRLPSADEGLSNLLEAYAREMLSRIPTDASFVERVRTVVERRLPQGSPGIEDTATELRMSARTVRRKLKEEGTTYRETLDTLRSNLARRKIEAGQQNMETIAQELGFSDASAFYKAFRRWTGTSPTTLAASFGDAVSSTTAKRGTRTGEHEA